MNGIKDLAKWASAGLTLPRAAAVCLLLASAAGCFWPLLRDPAGILVGAHDGGRNDLTCQFLAFRDLPRFVWEGPRQAPFWNPYLLAGTPWYGNPQSGLFYPPNWLFLLQPAQRIISWVLVLHHVWGGVGVLLLSRRYGCSWAAAVTSGVAFQAAPYLIAHTGEGHYNQICLIAWVPWAFLAWERLRENQPGSVALLAAVLSLCFFCGHVQELYYLMVILGALTLTALFRPALRTAGGDSSSMAWKESGRFLLRWLLTCLAVAGLTAVDFLPIWCYSRSAVRAAGLSAGEASQFSIGAANLLQLFNPGVWGGPDTYRGPGAFYWETLCYFGVAPLALAAAGSLCGWRRYPVLRFSLLAILSVAFAFGDDLPLFSLMHRYVPGMSLFRAPSRALFFASLAVAVLAGWGADALVAQAVRLFPGLAGRRRASADRGTSPGTSGVRTLASPATGGLLLGACLAALCAAELAVHAQRVLAVVHRSAERIGNPLAESVPRATEVERILAPQELLSDWEAWRAGLHKVHGYDPVPQARVALLLTALTPQRQTPEVLGNQIRLGEFHKPLLDLMGVRLAVTSGPAGQADGWREIGRGSLPPEFHSGRPRRPVPYAIYHNETALPRAFVIGSVSLIAPQADAIRELRRLEPRRRLLLDRDLLPPGPRQPFRPARIQRYSPNEVTVLAELAAPGYLVLTDLYSAGWRAEVDGKPAPILPADTAFRAVPLQPGRHLVRFHFEPAGARAGLWISLLTVLTLAWGTWRDARRRHQVR